jgi:hypothetical protein
MAAVEIDCELLSPHGWQIEGKWRSVGHGGCGIPLRRKHDVSTTKCYALATAYATAASDFLKTGA